MHHLHHAALLGSLLAATASFAADAPAVKVTKPVQGDVVRYVTVPGTIRANQQAVICAKVAGYLKDIRVDKGDTTKAGDAMAELEVPELEADLVKQRADVKVAATQLARLEGAVQKAPDLVTPSAVDEARARVETAAATLERAETLLTYAKITAPFSGIVTARAADPGAFIAAGGPLVTIADFATVRAQVALPEVDAALAKPGQPVKVSVEALPGKVFEGTVSRIAYALDDATRTMLVEADLPNADLVLRPGMYANVKVGVEKHSGVMLIPAEALVMEKANAFAFTVAEGKAKKNALKIGFNDGANVEVVSGLSADGAVILVGKMALTDGASVTVAEAK